MSAKGYRQIIRQFLEAVEWTNPRSVSILIHGDTSKLMWALTEMMQMYKEGQIKRLANEDHVIYAKLSSAKKDKGMTNLSHDLKLRDVLAKFLFDRQYDGIGRLSVKRIPGNPDAHLGNIYFEMDTGHEEPKQLKGKLERFSGPGQFQVLFFMANRYGDKGLENNRLDKLQELGKEILRHKPNRILASTYHGFLEYGQLYNLRNEVRDV